jgi:hypothetical protein
MKIVAVSEKTAPKCNCLAHVRRSSSAYSWVCPVHGPQDDPGCSNAFRTSQPEAFNFCREVLLSG